MVNADAAETATEQRVIGRPFQPGQSGNPAGRPKGARSKFSEAFIQDLHSVWEKRGIAAIDMCALVDPAAFLRVCASLMPKDITLSVAVDASAFAEKFRTAQALLGNPEPESTRRPLRPMKIINAG
jgi:Family of unknown function (DUF5681)